MRTKETVSEKGWDKEKGTTVIAIIENIIVVRVPCIIGIVAKLNTNVALKCENRRREIVGSRVCVETQ